MIYRDALGRPFAEATISVFTDYFRHEKTYSLHTTSDYKPSTDSWPIDTPIEQIIRSMEADGFSCTVRKNPIGETVIDCVHMETNRLIEARKKESESKFRNAEKGYVRYGEVPANGLSKNFRDNTLEKGVSCFEAEFAPDGSWRLLLSPALEVTWLMVCERKAYRLWGDRVGTGADGEPLLRVEREEELA